MHQTVLIVAGGSGMRMNSSIPKQFLLLNNIPILMHTINRFVKYKKDMEIRLVLPTAQIDLWKELCKKYNFTVKHQIYSGGVTRFQSVKNGLKNIQTDGIIAIHDGVRPIVHLDTIHRCFIAAENYGAAIPVTDVIETLREVSNNNSFTVNRAYYKIVQTPQVFLTRLIIEGYNQNENESFTDDASVVESLGHPITLVEGNAENIKITKPADIQIAEALLNTLSD